MTITKEELNEMFEYRDGALYYTDTNEVAEDKLSDSGIKTLTMPDGKTYRLHRVIWAFFNGPTRDHVIFKDGDRLNTRIENLEILTKEAAKELARANKPKKPVSDKPQLPRGGVYYSPKIEKWVAKTTGGKHIAVVGQYSTEYEAHRAWIDAYEAEAFSAAK